MFLHGINDDFVNPKHSVILQREYAGKSSLKLFEGNHNSIRTKAILCQVADFFYKRLKVKFLVPIIKQEGL